MDVNLNLVKEHINRLFYNLCLFVNRAPKVYYDLVKIILCLNNVWGSFNLTPAFAEYSKYKQGKANQFELFNKEFPVGYYMPFDYKIWFNQDVNNDNWEHLLKDAKPIAFLDWKKFNYPLFRWV
ncbi:Uncharacterised protein (plasmid) [Mesomycoplasma conjunctivae]|nr:Uncharacterised protein [Mesomycoplasma conjunctivae]